MAHPRHTSGCDEVCQACPWFAVRIQVLVSPEMRCACSVSLSLSFKPFVSCCVVSCHFITVTALSCRIMQCQTHALALVFRSLVDWQVVGGFWVGLMAWAAGVAGTCVSIKEHSGGFPTALFFFQSLMCLIAAALSLILVDGLGKPRGRGALARRKSIGQGTSITQDFCWGGGVVLVATTAASASLGIGPLSLVVLLMADARGTSRCCCHFHYCFPGEAEMIRQDFGRPFSLRRSRSLKQAGTYRAWRWGRGWGLG